MSYHFLHETFPKARRPHTCIWCGEQILKGETYRSENSIYDGHFQNFKWHLECDKASAEHYTRNGEEFSAHEMDRPKERLGFSTPPSKYIFPTPPAKTQTITKEQYDKVLHVLNLPPKTPLSIDGYIEIMKPENRGFPPTP